MTFRPGQPTPTPRGRPQLPRALRLCTAGCGRAVVVIAGDVPPVPVLCEPCRGPGPFPVVHARCASPACDRWTRVTGRRLRPWELGRPVTCSLACRRDNLSVTRPCRSCGKPLTRLASDAGQGYCHGGCWRAVNHPLPGERPCAWCRLAYRPRRRYFPDGGWTLTETCSPLCGANLREHRYRQRLLAVARRRTRRDVTPTPAKGRYGSAP